MPGLELIDPSLLDAIAKAAASATVGVAVRSSAPGWIRFVKRLKPIPRTLRRNPAWKDVELTRKHQNAIKAYIESPLCHGMLELLASLRIGDTQEAYQVQATQLGNAFTEELQHRLGDTDNLYRPVLDHIWQSLKASIELRINEVMSSEYAADAELLGASLTARRIRADKAGQASQIGAEDTSGETSTANRKKKALMIAAIVPERFHIAESANRSLEAQRLVERVQSAVRAGYSQIIMPHARDEYRVRLEDLYVHRNVTAIATRELHDFSLGLFGPSAAGSGTEEYSLSEDDVQDARFVLVGSPGAGKSTFVRHLVYKFCDESDSSLGIAPFVIELKTYNPERPKAFHEIIAEQLKSVDHIDTDASTVADLLAIGLGLVVFDGFDEITNLAHRRQAVQAIESFIRRFPLTKIVVTSRPEGYIGANLNPVLFSAYKLPDFTEAQVIEYVHKWFGLASGVPRNRAASAAEDFLRESATSAADLRTNPLMLSLLCMVYKYSGYIPENRPRIYEECTELLFERWDSVRHVRPDIEPDTKGRYMVQELAYFFFKNRVAHGGGIEEFRIMQVLQEYLKRNVIDDSEEARRRARNFLDYCAGRAWVLTKVGPSLKGERLFGFTHRTFMEYFVACYLVRQFSDPRRFVSTLREFIRDGSSDVVPQIAIQRFDDTIADGADDCISILLFDSTNVTDNLDSAYLPFVIRCIKYMVISPRTLTKVFNAMIRSYLTTRSPSNFAALVLPDDSCEYALEKYCRDLASGTGVSDEDIAMKVGCYHLVLSHKAPWCADVIRDLEDFLASNQRGLSHKYGDTLTVLLQRGRISISEFTSECGAKQLVTLGKSTIPGLFIEGLTDLARSTANTLSTDSAGHPVVDYRLDETAIHLFGQPSALLPINVEMAKYLIKNAEMFRHHMDIAIPIGQPVWAGLRAFALMVMLASIELDWSTTHAAYVLSNKILGPSTFDRFRRLRSGSAPLDREAQSRLRRLNISSDWLEYGQLWCRYDRSVIARDDGED